MFSLNTGVLEAEDVLSEQHTSSTTYDVMPKLNLTQSFVNKAKRKKTIMPFVYKTHCINVSRS